MINTYYDDLGRSWLEVDTEVWDKAEFTEYAFGYPIYTKRK